MNRLYQFLQMSSDDRCTGSNDTEEFKYERIRNELRKRFNRIKESIPEFEYCPEYDPVGFPNIKAVWIYGEKCGQKRTKVFGYIGFPDQIHGISHVNLINPGIVLQHGGGGHAFPHWISEWTRRGYVAIAVGNTGYYPAKEGITDFFSPSEWSHILENDEYTLAPDNDGMNSSELPIDQQWMYHAVSQTIIAHNILCSFDNIDKSRIGLTGISWGGVISSIAIGYDNRFAFAIPVYGSGYLYESLAWMKINFNYPGTREIWDASWNLKNVTMPVLWLCWTNDNCFSVNSNDKSFADTPNGILSMKMDMLHGHIEGWIQPEIYRFADSFVKGLPPLTACATQPEEKRNTSFTLNLPEDADKVTAKAYYIKEKMTYSPKGRLNLDWCESIDQEWFSVDCTVEGNRVTVMLPEEAYSYYIEITTTVDGVGYVTTTRFITINN